MTTEYQYTTPPALAADVVARRGRLHCFDELVPSKTALVVVDMQSGFLSMLPPAREIVPAINRLARALRAAGGQVVWVVWSIDPDPEKRWRILFDHVQGPEASAAFQATFSKGHEGQALWPALDFVEGEAIVGKTNFSGFSGSKGELEVLLRSRGLDTVLVAGTVTNVCCESTAREAAFLEFKTIMVSDANAGRAPADNDACFNTFLRVFGDVMSSAEILERL